MNDRQREFREKVWAEIGYTPTREQWIAHQDESRFILVAGGVGAGKSYWLARQADAYTWTPGGLGWIIGPNYELARPEWEYLKDAYQEVEAIKIGSVREAAKGSASFETIWDFKWVTKSAMKPEELAGRRPHIIILSEAAQHPRGIWGKVRERAAENRAPIFMSGTFEGAYGWYAELWERWQSSNPEGGRSYSIPTWSNLEKYPGGRQDPEILAYERDMPQELFLERFGGIPCKPSGLVFKEFDRNVHCAPLVKLFDPTLPVQVWTDPATHCYPVLFVQLQKPDAEGIQAVHVLDEVYAKNQIGQQVIPQVVNKPIPLEVRRALWPDDWQEKPATWWAHSCNTGVMDISGTYRQGANTTQVEVWADTLRGLNAHPIAWRSVRVMQASHWYDAIHLRLMHGAGRAPQMKFADHLNDRIDEDGRACGVLGELKTHRWAERDEMASMPGRPVKRNEDALSALGFGCLVNFGSVLVRKKAPIKRTVRRYV